MPENKKNLYQIFLRLCKALHPLNTENLTPLKFNRAEDLGVFKEILFTSLNRDGKGKYKYKILGLNVGKNNSRLNLFIDSFLEEHIDLFFKVMLSKLFSSLHDLDINLSQKLLGDRYFNNFVKEIAEILTELSKTPKNDEENLLFWIQSILSDELKALLSNNSPLVALQIADKLAEFALKNFKNLENIKASNPELFNKINLLYQLSEQFLEDPGNQQQFLDILGRSLGELSLQKTESKASVILELITKLSSLPVLASFNWKEYQENLKKPSPENGSSKEILNRLNISSTSKNKGPGARDRREDPRFGELPLAFAHKGTKPKNVINNNSPVDAFLKWIDNWGNGLSDDALKGFYHFLVNTRHFFNVATLGKHSSYIANFILDQYVIQIFKTANPNKQNNFASSDKYRQLIVKIAEMFGIETEGVPVMEIQKSLAQKNSEKPRALLLPLHEFIAGRVPDSLNQGFTISGPSKLYALVMNANDLLSGNTSLEGAIERWEHFCQSTQKTEKDPQYIELVDRLVKLALPSQNLVEQEVPSL